MQHFDAAATRAALGFDTLVPALREAFAAQVQVPPPAPTQVQVPVSTAGRVSATVAPVTGSGPALLAVRV